MRKLLLVACCLFPSQAFAIMNARGAFVTDAAGAPRSAFTSTEQIAMTQTVQLTEPEPTSVSFTFRILNPSGQQVFLHTGNSSPGGTAGDASARVAGIPISQFYSVPGQYTLVAEANAGSNPTVTQRTGFSITSPILTLLYPPDGVRGLEDRPLVLHWTGSGASRYRVQVSDEGSFYRTLLAGLTNPGESTFTYPENPSDNRQRLTGGQVYYWRVQALDASGNTVAQSGTYSFSLKGSAVGGQTRDLAVIALDLVPGEAHGEGALPFRVTVRNQGGTTETNAKLRFTLGGMAAPKSPFKLPVLTPGEEHSLVSPIKPATEQESALAVACLDLFDDSVLNNCKTLVVVLPKAKPLTPGSTEQAPLPAGTTEQVTVTGPDTQANQAAAAAAFNSLKSQMDPAVSDELKGYHADSIEADGMSAAEARGLLDDIKKGKAKILEMVVE